MSLGILLIYFWKRQNWRYLIQNAVAALVLKNPNHELPQSEGKGEESKQDNKPGKTGKFKNHKI